MSLMHDDHRLHMQSRGSVRVDPMGIRPIRLAGVLNSAMLASAAIYLALLPSNAWTYARSLSFGIAAAIAFAALVGSLIKRNERTPSPGFGLLLCVALWSAWSVASLTWSLRPGYSAEELKREVGWSLLTMLIFYMSARNAHSWRVLLRYALTAFAFYSALALAMAATAQGWDPSRWHSGVGPYSTHVVLIAPLLLTFLIPPPGGFGGKTRGLAMALVLLALLVASARLTENRMVWIALSVTFLTAAVLAAVRWRSGLARVPLRWIAPLFVLLVALGALFLDAARERANADFPPRTTISQTLSEDPRLPLWDHTLARVMQRPWVGFGFGRAILADQLKDEMRNPVLWHAHNIFVSQWLQTGAIGLILFAALIFAVGARFIRFIRGRDDATALIGIVGIAVLVGFLVKNLTDDFLFRSDAKEFWALLAMLLGYGVRSEVAAAEIATKTPSNAEAFGASAPVSLVSTSPPQGPSPARAAPSLDVDRNIRESRT